ncbi:hypothetical protein C8Q75DRAFT_567260 [Abortiporus biennis]|nr:hypothetical protein C8Q75DRAFT_567260 [Abortiporus biennis]
MNIMIDILDVPEQELSQGTQRVDLWTMGSTSSSDDVVDSVPDSTYFSNVPTMLEWQWMGDMGGLYEVYETYAPPSWRSPQLPWEILRLVLDELERCTWLPKPSKATVLSSCCLACHAFLYQCRPRLYRDVILRCDSMVHSFLDAITQNSHLQGLTIHITLATSGVKAYHRLLLYGKTILPKQKSLKLLHMPVLNSQLISHRCLLAFPSLTRLDLWHCTFSLVLDLRCLIYTFFPKLSSLIVYSLQLTSSYVTLPHKWPRKMVSLSNLEIYGSGEFEPVRRWLCSTPPQTSIHTLHIDCYHLKMPQSFGQNIQELYIFWNVGDIGQDSTNSLGPGVLPILKVLRVAFKHHSHLPDFCAMFSRCIPSSTLACIQIHPFSFSNMSIDLYSPLDDTFAILPPHTRVEIDVEIWKSLPKLKEMGMLAVPISCYNYRNLGM